MANLPEKNITTVDKITSIPSNTNLYINANGEFRQATVDDVLKASPVIADSITNQYKNASGSPILLTDSAKGVAIDFDVKGRSTQTQYSGKNLWSGGDVSGTKYKEVMIDIDKGTYTISALVTSSGTDASNSSIHFFNESGADFLQIYLTRGVRASKTFNLSEKAVKCWFLAESTYANSDNDTFGYTDIQLESGEKATDYEPYTNGASPNPSYPQAIKSNGDMGYFDGELLQGYYDHTTGKQTTNTTYVCSKNPIPCNPSDNVVLQYKETVSRLSIVFYDKNMKHISFVYIDNADTFTTTIPTNAHYFHFNIGYGSSITPQTAKHICVTINDKYALIVDSVGKNKFNIDGNVNTKGDALSQLSVNSVSNGVLTNNVNGTNAHAVGQAIRGLKGKTITISANLLSLGSGTLGHIGVYENGKAKKNVQSNTIGGLLLLTYTCVSDEIIVGFATIGGTGAQYSNIQVEINDTATPYEPYKKSRKYIPISAPLRGIGEVTDVARLTECKVDRKLWSDVFDGSNLKCHTVVSLNTVVRATCSLSQKGITYGTKFCSHLPIVIDYNLDTEHCYTSDVSVHLFINKERLSSTDVEGVNEWLQANPITVIYELAEPTTETIEYVDIDTFEGVTQVSVIDNADMEVEYPTSKVAGIASIGWSKGRRAEYDLEQLKVQMLALQTTIVSTV